MQSEENLLSENETANEDAASSPVGTRTSQTRSRAHHLVHAYVHPLMGFQDELPLEEAAQDIRGAWTGMVRRSGAFIRDKQHIVPIW